MQAVIQLIGLVCIGLSISSDKDLNRLAISAPVIALLSLLIGVLGQFLFFKFLECLVFNFVLLLMLIVDNL